MAADPQPAIDSNTWYQFTESRVDFNSSLQYNGQGIFFAAQSEDAEQYWQFYTEDSSTYQIRNRNTATKQLGTCYNPSEVTAPKTQPCMVPASDDDSQKWTVSTWSDGTYKIQNVGNGTDYNMDVHPGNPLFMSSATAETPKQPAQHWEIQSIGEIDDGTFSTALGAVCLLATHFLAMLLTSSRRRHHRRPHPQRRRTHPAHRPF
jgi:hypothetical protein